MYYFVAALFSNKITQIIQKGKYVDVRVCSDTLIKQFNDKKGRNILIRFLKNPQNEQKYLRILSVLGIALIYSEECYQTILNNLEVHQFSSSWISKQILSPFAKWVKKCCETVSLFKQIKKKSSKNETVMDRIPYCINLLKEILNIIQQIPKFARYYNLQDEHKEYVMFSQILLALNNMIYSHLKITLQTFLSTQKKEKVIIHKEVIRWIYNEVLPDINDKIKSVTLNRHLDFYHKGIAVKLIYPDQYNSKAKNILEDLLYQRRCKSRSTEYEQLESQIFPMDGSFDKKLFYTTLEETSRQNRQKDIKIMLNGTLPISPARSCGMRKIKKIFL